MADVQQKLCINCIICKYQKVGKLLYKKLPGLCAILSAHFYTFPKTGKRVSQKSQLSNHATFPALLSSISSIVIQRYFQQRITVVPRCKLEMSQKYYVIK